MITINIAVLSKKYDFNVFGISFQYRYKNDTATNLPNSNDDAITIADVGAPANNLPMPVTEKYAADAAIANAVKAITLSNVINFICSLKMGR